MGEKEKVGGEKKRKEEGGEGRGDEVGRKKEAKEERDEKGKRGEWKGRKVEMMFGILKR